MNTDRDKFMTEAMGNDWHTVGYAERDIRRGVICNCGSNNCAGPSRNISLSTWQGFGKLWEWAQEQEFFLELLVFICVDIEGKGMDIEFAKAFNLDSVSCGAVNPDRFANAVYEFLKGRES
jgi:hypothetical protein